MLNRSRCVVLVPVYDQIERPCEESLQALEARGYRVRRVWTGAAPDLGRSKLATAALDDGYDELMWIDSDIAFPADAVDLLRDRDLPIVSGVYPKKADSAVSFHSLGLEEVRFGESIGGLIEIGYAPAGFLYTRREVYEDVQRASALPICNESFGDRIIPFFLPLIVDDPPGRHWYLAEDFAFCHRARQAGYRIVADTTLRLWHIGKYAYSWEDSGGDRPRGDEFVLSCRLPDGWQRGRAPAPSPWLARAAPDVPHDGAPVAPPPGSDGDDAPPAPRRARPEER